MFFSELTLNVVFIIGLTVVAVWMLDLGIFGARRDLQPTGWLIRLFSLRVSYQDVEKIEVERRELPASGTIV